MRFCYLLWYQYNQYSCITLIFFSFYSRKWALLTHFMLTVALIAQNCMTNAHLQVKKHLYHSLLVRLIRPVRRSVKPAEVCVYTAPAQEPFLINSSWQMQQNGTSRLWEQAHLSHLSLSLFRFPFLPHINSYYIQTTIFHHPPLPNLFFPSFHLSHSSLCVFLARTCFSS